MTAQATDRVLVEEQEYALLGRSGDELFNPEKHGLNPVSVTSANHRGFGCTYAIHEKHLLLQRVRLHLFLEGRRTDTVPLLFGRTAEVSWLDDRLEDMKKRGFFNGQINEIDRQTASLRYEDLAAEMPFTGGLLLGANWADENYSLRRGQHRACYYADVREVILRDGRVTQEYNHSSAVAAIRAKMQELNYTQIREQIEGLLSRKSYYGY